MTKNRTFTVMDDVWGTVIRPFSSQIALHLVAAADKLPGSTAAVLQITTDVMKADADCRRDNTGLPVLRLEDGAPHWLAPAHFW